MRASLGLSALAVAIVVGAGLTAIPPGASAATSSGPADAQDAPDTATAQSIAVAHGHAVRIDSGTTAQSTVSALPDGSFQLQASNVPVRVKQGSSWVKVNTDLVRDGAWFEPTASATPVRFSSGGSDVLDQVQSPSGDWITETWPHGTLPTPTISGRTATYADVLPGVDLKLTATELGMASVYVVKSAAAAVSSVLSSLNVDVQGATLTRNASGTYTAKSGDGAMLTGSSPVWWDSSDGGTFIQPGGDDPMRPVTSSLATSAVAMNVGATIGAAAVTYPIYVDPDWSSGVSASWYTDRAFPNQSYLSASASSVLRVGIYSTYNSDMFFQFPISALSGKQVTSSTLSTTQDSIDACPTNPISVEVYGPQGAGFTWNQEQSYGSGQWHGVLQTQSPGSCSSPSTPVAVGWNVTSGVASAVGQSTIELGITSAASSMTRRHYERAAMLTVTYDTPPNTPTGPTFDTPSRACSTSATAPVSLNSAAGVAVHVNQTDPDGGNVAVNFYLQDITTNTLVSDPTTSLQAQGDISATFPAASFTNGDEYGWRAQGSDYMLVSSGFTPWCYFTVDDTAPTAPAVTTTATSMTIGEPIPVTITPGTATDVAGFEYWLSYSSATSPAAAPPVVIGTTAAVPACGSQQGAATFVCPSGGSATASVAPVDDESVLWVASYDAAGNLSTATPLSLRNADGSDADEPAAAAWHEWYPFDSGSPLPSTLPDQNTGSATDTTGEQDLGLGSSLPLNVTDAVGSQTGVPVLSFPGTMSAGTVAQTGSAGVDTTQSLSVSAWVKPASTTATMAIMAQSGASNSGFVLEDVAGHMTFCVRPQTGSAPADCATATSVSAAGSWVMVTGIWDAVNHQVKLVVGSSPTAAVVVPHVPPTGEISASGPVTIGSAQAGGVAVDPWNGEIAAAAMVQAALDTNLLNYFAGLFS